jgi:hypothetical protein
MILNAEYTRNCKDFITTYLKVLPLNSLGLTKARNKIPARIAAFQQRFEQDISRIRVHKNLLSPVPDSVWAVISVVNCLTKLSASSPYSARQ